MANSSIVARIDFNDLPAIAARLTAGVGPVVRETLFEIEADIKERMAEPKSGRDYDGHIASAPGEAPAIDDGQLVNSVQTELTGPASGIVGTGQEQAPVLELGGADIEARPSFGPAAEAAQERFTQRIQDLLP